MLGEDKPERSELCSGTLFTVLNRLFRLSVGSQLKGIDN